MDVVERYNKYYFTQHPKARKKQIEHPYHPSINVWSIKPRIQMNALKQQWKQFIIWWINDLGYTDMKLDNFDLLGDLIEKSVNFEPKKYKSNVENFRNTIVECIENL